MRSPSVSLCPGESGCRLSGERDDTVSARRFTAVLRSHPSETEGPIEPGLGLRGTGDLRTGGPWTGTTEDSELVRKKVMVFRVRPDGEVVFARAGRVLEGGPPGYGCGDKDVDGGITDENINKVGAADEGPSSDGTEDRAESVIMGDDEEVRVPACLHPTAERSDEGMAFDERFDGFDDDVQDTEDMFAREPFVVRHAFGLAILCGVQDPQIPRSRDMEAKRARPHFRQFGGGSFQYSLGDDRRALRPFQVFGLARLEPKCVMGHG